MPRTSSRMKRSTPRLSEIARKVAAPKGAVATGWPAVRETLREKMGVTLDPWQDQVGSLILAKREDGWLASTIDGVGMSLPRQVGKTYLIASLTFALCVNTPGLLVRSEEHTSELQSRGHLVCLLRLEKKNTNDQYESCS